MDFGQDPTKRNGQFQNDFYTMDYTNDFSQQSQQPQQPHQQQSNSYMNQPGQQSQGYSSPFPQGPSSFNSVPPNGQGFGGGNGSGGQFGMPGAQQQQQQQQQPNFNMNQQFLMAAGQQLLSNPVAAAAIDAYSQSLVDRSKTWMGSLKSFFAVDTSYVIKKIMIIFLPFLHKEWCIRYSSESVLPKDEPNLPDLYIPSMAFITYCLLSGYILGLRNQFAPDQIGIYASAAMAWLLLEVFVILIAKYVLNTSSSLLGFFQLIAFGGYKFVCTVFILLSAVMFGRNGYLGMFAYTSFTLMYFLMKSLNTNLQTSQDSAYSGYDVTRSGKYLIAIVCLFQPLVMYFLTSSLV